MTDSALDLPQGSVGALIVDSHPVTRIGLGVLLQRQPWVSRCALAADREEAIVLAQHHRPDIAVVDVSGTGATMSPVLATLRAVRPAMPVVLAHLSAPAGPARLLGGGSSEILTADLPIERVLGVIRAALLGDEVPRGQPVPAESATTQSLSPV